MPTKILDAKLWMLEWWFFPEPGNNRFHELMLDKESKIIFLEHELKLSKRKNRKMLYVGAGIGSALILVPALILKILN